MTAAPPPAALPPEPLRPVALRSGARRLGALRFGARRFVLPVAFVFIWSTGFIVAKVALPHADLELFLIARFSSTALVMGAFALAAGVAWPRGRLLGLHLAIGTLIQGAYLCVSYWSISRGMPAGAMALLGALQPLFTALIVATFVDTRLHVRTWCGLLIGFAGVALVLSPRLARSGVGSVTFLTALCAFLSVFAVTAGTFFQSRLRTTDLRSAAAVQNVGAAVFALGFAWLTSDWRWDGTLVLWLSLAWAVLVVSAMGLTLLMWMVRHGEATKVTALLLLVPPLAAVQAYVLFDEALSPIQYTGFALALGGVLLARSAATAAADPTSSAPAR